MKNDLQIFSNFIEAEQIFNSMAKCTRLTNILQREQRRSPASQKQIHKVLMRKNDPCFCLVFGKANQSGLLFLIRQANLLRNNPISFSRNIDLQGYVCMLGQ